MQCLVEYVQTLPAPYWHQCLQFSACCCSQMSDRELYDKVVSCAEISNPHAGWVSARAQLLLQQLAVAGLSTRQQCLEYLGSHFRIVLGSPDR